MERRIIAIIRWLERCSKECSAGTLESALMDVECARADIDRLRDEVWAKLERRHTAKVRARSALTFVHVLFLSLGVVMAAPTSTDRFQEAPAMSFSASVRPTVAEPPNEISRETVVAISVNETRHEIVAQSPPLSQQQERAKTRPSTENRGENKSTPAPKKIETHEEEKYIPYDRIISLVQTGEKALKNTEPAIKVEK